MPVTLEQLLPGYTADDAKALLITSLQGVGPVQQIGDGAGTMVVVGSPLGIYDVVIQIQTAGAPGTASINYSFDGGVSVTGPFIIPANGEVILSGTGLTLLFAGIFDTGNQYLFQTIFPPFPVTDWEPGGIGRTFLESDAAVLADFGGTALGEIAGGGFVDYASDAGAPNSWLALLSAQLYNNGQYEPVATVGLLQLTLASTAPSLSVAAGALVFSNTIGNSNQFLYTNENAVSMSPGDVLTIPIIADQPGAAYNLVNGAITVLITPQPGLTCNNPSPGTSSVTKVGGGSGTITVFGGPNANYTVDILITSSGAAGTGKLQYSLDGGANYNAPQTIPSSGVLALETLGGQTTGLSLLFLATFNAATTYSFTAFNSWITTLGQNLESTTSLQTRDKGKWGTLGIGGGTAATYDYLARSTPNGGSEVVKTFWSVDTSNGGQVDGVVSGSTGPVSAGALTAITAYITARLPLCVALSLSNSSTVNITLTGVVYVIAAQLAAAKSAIQAAVSAYIASVPLGGIVYANEIIAAVENQSASGVVNYTQSVPAPNSEQQLAAGQVAAIVDFSGLTYVLQ